MQNKTFTITLIVILSILVFLLSFALFFLLYKNGDLSSYFNFSFKDKAVKILEEEYELENINNLKFDFKSSDISIKKSDNEKLKVIVYSSSDKIDVSNDETSITFSDKNKNICIGFCFINSRVEVYLPESYSNNLQLNTVSGDIEIYDNYDNLSLDINTVSGDLTIPKVYVLNAKTTSGNIDIDSLDKVEIQTVSGDIDINSVNKKIKLKTTSGDISIKQLSLEEDGSINTISGDVKINSSSNIYVETKTISGDIDVNSDRFSKVTLSIKTTSGDIEVN